ncbi:hypothetical protein DDB_G0291161 [Dictyostelium discoideum AX4]|uniref:Maestro heat-like repeat-containing protein family member 1 n=1 Tax=Dictyostelium discoideum TaxID=44689 RepID=MROH1_DICDI|nr:hypothetical protein DDB_G0291161 [Dictyostelium discoideum AX4]Q54F23.1 RecName: Full=Maestro heat-like repeat-containing protein family member 1; AltName: Full=HEAT repeat-containing protein 7A homolog [Dictyostelium discoideum]EAL61864.1 hypothetical protein DDB_G0291161 [Dictyostelium discoideum AX4]|eukprot:XP_635367.1 hypothetical protein DDB_G0291161 [Dictyostelium discoideum AX4]
MSKKNQQISPVLDNIVTSLLQSLSDSDESVRSTVVNSLYEIGFRQPNFVLQVACDYINKNQKIDQTHRVKILNSILQILEQTRNQLTDALSLNLIAMSISEMTRDKEVVPDWQQVASSLLVSLGLRYPSQIMDELLKRFEPGTLPHYFVMKTLGDFISSNPIPTVPKIREILSRILPVLGTIKHDNFKWVFAAALGHFADAIVQYVANIDTAPDKSLTLYSFSSEFYPALELMFSKWLGTNHEKVRLVTIEAVGSICSILSVEQLESQIQKLVVGVLSMLKKEKDLLPVTHSLCCILEVCVKNDLKLQVNELLIPIMTTLHPLVCIVPDYSNPASTKTYNEVLRCFEVIGRGYSDVLISFLNQRLENRDLRSRAGSLSIIRHIVTRLDVELADKKPLILSAIKPLIQTEPSLFIKKYLAQIIIAMAPYGYLEMEGGLTLLEFIVKGSSWYQDSEIGKAQPTQPPKKIENPDLHVTDSELRLICDNILNLITTTMPQLESILWPYLFEFILPEQYTAAIPVVTKSLTYIALSKKSVDSDDYYIDFDKEINLPKPTQIIARYFVLLTAPLRRNQLGIRILENMKAIGPILHPSICDMWDVTLPKLISYLEDHTDIETWNKNQWEELVLRLLSETIKNAADDEWTVALGNSMSEQIDHYKKDPILKRSLYKQMGLIMQKCSHKEFVKSKIEVMFTSVDYTNSLENEGCAIGLGYCGASHFDIVLEKINFYIKNSMVKKSGFFGKKGPKGIKNCILLSLGYSATYAQSALFSSRVEVHVIQPIKPSILQLKKVPKKLSSIKMIDLIGKALHPNKASTFIFKQRDELMKLLISYMSTPPPSTNNQVKIDGTNACSTLVNLEPMISLELEVQIINLSLSFFNQQVSPANATNTDSDEYKEVNSLITSVNNLLSTILYNQTTIACLNRLIGYLDPLSRSKDAHIRERSLFCILYLVKKFIEYSTDSDSMPTDKLFDSIGTTLSVLIPRCTDPEINVRRYAVESIQLILYIGFMLKNATPDNRRVKPSEVLHPLTSIRDSITTTEVNEQFSLVFEISVIISKMISLEEIPKFLEGSIKGLQDLQAFSTNGSCIIINGLIKTRGEELIEYVPILVKGLLTAMEGITSETTMNGTLVSLRSLANHHLIPVLSVLLEYPMPHSVHVIKSFQIIAKDKNLISPTLIHLMDLLNNKPVYEEKPDPKNKNRIIPQPFAIALAATCSLGEIFQLTEVEEVVKYFYHQLISTLVLRAGTCNNSLPCLIEVASTNPKAKASAISLIPSQQMLVTFRQFFKCTKEEETLLAEIESKGSFSQLETPFYHQGIIEILSVVSSHHPDLIQGIFQYLLPYQRSNHLEHRIVTISVTTELINHCKDKELIQRLINTLLNSLVDPLVKLISLKGLSNIVSAGVEQTNRYAPTVIDALSTSIDDQDETMAMECMLGLSKIFEVADEGRVAPILVNICNRIRPAFEKPNDSIRAASFQLFGSLWRFGSGSACDPFYEQIHSSLPSLIMHLNDDVQSVKNSCKKTLFQLSTLMRSQDAMDYFNNKSKGFVGDNDQPNYEEFLLDFSKLLIINYPERVNYFVMTVIEFFKSTWVNLRGNAATFIGFILGNLTEDKRTQTNINSTILTKSLVGLLAEKSPAVRKKAAESLGLLHHY